jgi:hypothetical protein
LGTNPLHHDPKFERHRNGSSLCLGFGAIAVDALLQLDAHVDYGLQTHSDHPVVLPMSRDVKSKESDCQSSMFQGWKHRPSRGTFPSNFASLSQSISAHCDLELPRWDRARRLQTSCFDVHNDPGNSDRTWANDPSSHIGNRSKQKSLRQTHPNEYD